MITCQYRLWAPANARYVVVLLTSRLGGFVVVSGTTAFKVETQEADVQGDYTCNDHSRQHSCRSRPKAIFLNSDIRSDRINRLN